MTDDDRRRQQVVRRRLSDHLEEHKRENPPERFTRFVSATHDEVVCECGARITRGGA